MRNPVVQEPANDALRPLDAALQRWVTDSRLASIASAAFLVLDREGGRLLHASQDASGFSRAIADGQGQVLPVLGLSAQIRRLGALDAQPRLVRLRLDTRGISPPLPCRVASAAVLEGVDALLIAPLVIPAGLRPARARSVSQDTSGAEEPTPQPLAAPTAPSGRFTWRSDGHGVITQVSGAGTTLTNHLLGKSWLDLCDVGTDSESLRAALGENRTFRALRIIVPAGDQGGQTHLDISGSPTGRPNGAAASFAGFAILREQEAVSAPTVPSEPETIAPVELSTSPAGEQHAVEGEPDSAESREQLLDPDRLEQPRPDADELDQHVAAAALVERAADTTGPASTDLSSDEHAAFREIARALGARFAGDEPQPSASNDQPAVAEVVSPTVEATVPLSSAIRAAFEGLPTALLVHRDGEAVFCNRRFLDLAGISDVDALGHVQGVDALLSAPETPLADEIVALERPDGESVWICIERSKLDWDGTPAEAVAARLAPTIAESKHEPVAPPQPDPGSNAQALLDGLPDGVVTLDRGGHVLTFNPKAAAIFAEESPSLVGKRFSTLFGPEGTEVIDESLSQAREAGTSEPRELAGRSAVPLRVRIARLFSNDDAPLYATLQDVEAPKRATDDASAIRRGIEEVARRKLAFFAHAGEEVRAPLGGVLSVTQAMLDEQFGPLGSERYREHLRDIQTFGGKALGLVNDLVDFAGIESGQSPLAFSDVPLNELVSSCIAQMQPRAARERILVRTSFASDLQPVHADERSLRQAAMNAIAHAIRLSEPGGQVIVSTMLAERGEIALRVRDTGYGMTAEEIARALEPFQVDANGTPKVLTGVGLGLTLTKALVEANRGRLRITSGKDEGTLVEMLLPPRAANA